MSSTSQMYRARATEEQRQLMRDQHRNRTVDDNEVEVSAQTAVTSIDHFTTCVN